MRTHRRQNAGRASRATGLSAARLWLVAAALAVVAFLVVWELGESGVGAALLGKVLGERDLSERAEALDRAVDGALVQVGALDLNVETETRSEGRTRWPHWTKVGRVPQGADLVRCNLALTEAVRAAAGDIIIVRERPPDWRGGRTLDMKLGLGRRETHQIVLRETPGAPQPRPARAPRIAIVIDDVGYGESRTMQAVLDLDGPITVAVVPRTAAGKATAAAAHDAGKEVILHLPMEPQGYPGVDPGEGALLLEHSAADIRRLLGEALDDVPHAVGVSNHMGSAFTADRAQMRALLSALKARGLFFFDSMTTAQSVGLSEAMRARVPVARNSMFLDSRLDEQGRVAVPSRLRDLEALARTRGAVAAIGHPHRETIAALRREMPAMKERGIEFVFLSTLVSEEVGP
ncbi:MAG: divergent polysaccharide deacetylase family protein [Candidatus Eisenbacteria bacterium]|nr:divergent polysaccharide deacetylase family protein [Candidatus Eisenbacteria bacterium]